MTELAEKNCKGASLTEQQRNAWEAEEEGEKKKRGNDLNMMERYL